MQCTDGVSFVRKNTIVLYCGTMGPHLCIRNKNRVVMIGNLITLALAALAIWLLVDSAVEFVQDTREDSLATEP